jgi:hypothetical protein
MIKHALLGAALLAAALANPVMAQQVMPEPAYCAQFYPMANCQNKGPGNPYSDGGYFRNSSNLKTENAPVLQPQRHHHRMHKHTH